jgi:hypothetical protein
MDMGYNKKRTLPNGDRDAPGTASRFPSPSLSVNHVSVLASLMRWYTGTLVHGYTGTLVVAYEPQLDYL